MCVIPLKCHNVDLMYVSHHSAYACFKSKESSLKTIKKKKYLSLGKHPEANWSLICDESSLNKVIHLTFFIRLKLLKKIYALRMRKSSQDFFTTQHFTSHSSIKIWTWLHEIAEAVFDLHEFVDVVHMSV